MKIKASETIYAEKHLHHVLKYDNLLCRMIKNSVDIREGSFYIYLFEGHPKRPICDFSQGFISETSENITESIGEAIYRKSAEKNSYIYIADDVMATENDVADAVTTAKFENEIYHILDKTEIGASEIDRILVESSVSWHSLSVILNIETKEKALTYLKTKKCPYGVVSEIIAGAFDGQGYLCWSLI